MTTFKDTDIREALRRKYADTPQLSADFMAKMQQAASAPSHRHVIPRWVWPAAIGVVAASILLLLSFLFMGEKTDRQPVAKEPVATPVRHLAPSATMPVVAAQAEETAPVQPAMVSSPATISSPTSHPLSSATSAPMITSVSKKTTAQQPVISPQPIVVSQNDSSGQAQTNDTSSAKNIAYYIARLEAEMDALDDSVNAAQMEELIAADVHLQQLVNRVVHGRAEQALNEAKPDSTANYIHF